MAETLSTTTSTAAPQEGGLKKTLKLLYVYTLAIGTIFTFSRAEETVEVVAARGKCARYLGIEEGYPVLRVLSRLFDDAGAVAVASCDSYNPNLVRLTVTNGAMVTENPPAP